MPFLDSVHQCARLFLPLMLCCACNTVPKDTSDSSPPTVTFYVLGDDGNYTEATSAKYSNHSGAFLKIRASVRDPEGVRSNDTRFSDSLVDWVHCNGQTNGNGPFEVNGLPAPATKTASGSKVPVRCSIYMTIKDTLRATGNGETLSDNCFPTEGETIAIRCIGKNWSANVGNSTTTAFFTIEIIDDSVF